MFRGQISSFLKSLYAWKAIKLINKDLITPPDFYTLIESFQTAFRASRWDTEFTEIIDFLECG